MNTPNISIIVPVYNAENTIIKCIDSILCQTYRCFELLLIDDCSIDNSLTICNNYANIDNRVKVFNNVTNQGVTLTRNKGLDNAVGEYVIFIDNDDYIDSNYINVFIDALRDHPNKDLYTQNVVFHYIDKDPYIVSNQLELGGPWGKLFSRKIIEHNKIRFIPHLQYNEDNLFLLDYLEKSNNQYNINNAGYHYMIHENCTSKKLESNYVANSFGLIIILKRIEENVFKNEYNSTFAKNRCRFIFHRYISSLYKHPISNIRNRRKNFRSVITSSKHSFSYYPETYKLDRIIKVLLKIKLISTSFYINEFAYYFRQK